MNLIQSHFATKKKEKIKLTKKKKELKIVNTKWTGATEACKRF